MGGLMNASDAQVVRPKSSQRKQRTPEARTARPPSQDRSRLRHAGILDAAEALLRSANIEDLSLGDVAARAGFSKASVHYHFPTIADLQFELGQKYDRELAQLLSESHTRRADMRVPSWQEWMRLESGIARSYFNNHRPACEALLGPLLHRRNRLAGMEYNALVGRSKLQNLDTIFVVPNAAALEEVFRYHGEIIDTFWSMSYLRHGVIDDAAFENALLASVGYLRNFIPEVLPMREPSEETTP